MKALFLTLLLSSCVFAGGTPRSLPTARSVDIERYLGKWYAITSLPQFFTRNCVAQTAEYGLINTQTISVLNSCIKKNGKISTISGEAVVANSTTNAELIVTFDSFFTRLFRVKGDYTIIKLDSDYRYVLVGSKNRKSLWLLARDKNIPEPVKSEYIEYARGLSFPVEDLIDSRF